MTRLLKMVGGVTSRAVVALACLSLGACGSNATSNDAPSDTGLTKRSADSSVADPLADSHVAEAPGANASPEGKANADANLPDDAADKGAGAGLEPHGEAVEEAGEAGPPQGEAEAGAEAVEAGGAEAQAAEAAAPTDEQADAGPAEPEPGPDPKVLLKEARSKRTKDERALAALAEAEAAGAKDRDLAKAAFERGEALFANPEQAAKFFQWSADKDKRYPEPMFALAKQAAVKGDVEDAKALLVQVKARKGTKLLSQIEFDPMWEILKDDPDVRDMLQ